MCNTVTAFRRCAVIVDRRYVLRHLSDENDRSAVHEDDGSTNNLTRIVTWSSRAQVVRVNAEIRSCTVFMSLPWHMTHCEPSGMGDSTRLIVIGHLIGSMSLQATARNVETKGGVCGQGELGADLVRH